MSAPADSQRVYSVTYYHGGSKIIATVWMWGPPFGGWANPSLIGRSEVEDIEYFEKPQLAAPHIRLDLRVSDHDPYWLADQKKRLALRLHLGESEPPRVS